MSKQPKMTVDADGTKQWFLNNKLHRTDGPAIEYTNGVKYWYCNGKLHRTDGPAVEWFDGTKWWHLNNRAVTALDVFWEAMKTGNKEAADNIVQNYGDELKQI